MRNLVSLAAATLLMFGLASASVGQSRQTVGSYLPYENLSYWCTLPPPKPFAYFEEDDSGDSTVNAFLLSYLSDEVYPRPSETFSYSWIEDFGDSLEDDGMRLVTYESYAWTGTEVAIMELNEAMIVVFRGSHGGDSNAINYFAD